MFSKPSSVLEPIRISGANSGRIELAHIATLAALVVLGGGGVAGLIQGLPGRKDQHANDKQPASSGINANYSDKGNGIYLIEQHRHCDLTAQAFSNWRHDHTNVVIEQIVRLGSYNVPDGFLLVTKAGSSTNALPTMGGELPKNKQSE